MEHFVGDELQRGEHVAANARRLANQIDPEQCLPDDPQRHA